MAFDMGFDFRATLAYVTDPAYGVAVLGEAYPHTYTNGNGDSVNAGWSFGQSTNIVNRSSTNDPRIAGIDFRGATGTELYFQVNLASGSAPGAGDYSADIAAGDAGGANKVDYRLLDTTTVLIDGTNGGAGYSPAQGHYIDATLSDVAATTTWTGTPVTKTFATTLAKYGTGVDNLSGANCVVAHFRLTQAAGAAKQLVSSLMLLGVGM